MQAPDKSIGLRGRFPLHLRYVLSVMGILLLIHALLRLAFVLYNSAQAHALPWETFFTSMLVGLRYDVATVFIFNGGLFLMLSLPFSFARHPVTYRIMNWLVLLVNLPSFVVNGVDIVYYSYAEKRLTHELFTTGDDMLNFDPVKYFLEFWPVILFFIVMVACFMWVMRKVRLRLKSHTLSLDNPRSLKAWVAPFCYLVVMAAGIRGGFQREWLNPTMAFVTGNFFAGNVGLNSAFTVLYAIDRKEEPLSLMPEQEAMQVARNMVRNEFDVEFADESYPFYRRSSFDAPPRKYNVVILLIESLNAEMLGCISGNPYTPTIDSLAKAGRLYTHFFANGSRSIEAQPAVFNSLPDVFTRPTIGSHYSRNEHRGLAHILGDEGYSTAYFHGGENGVLGLDSYAKVSGFQRYMGMDEYPNPEKDFDGLWGLYDEPFLQWMAQEQSNMKEPFFTAFFSCTNHHPFPLPKTGVEEIERIPVTPQMRTVIYTDRALKRYFNSIRGSGWFDSTVFVLTGDHCFYLESDPSRPLPEQFHVPLIIAGAGITPRVDGRIGSQICIQPTLIDHLRIPTWHASTGVSLLRESPEPFAINSLMGVVSFTQGRTSISTKFEEEFGACVLTESKWRTLASHEEIPAAQRSDLERKLKGLYQQLQHCRVGNRFVPNASDEKPK